MPRLRYCAVASILAILLSSPALGDDATKAVYLRYDQSAKGYQDVYIKSRGRAVKATVRQSWTNSDGKPQHADLVKQVPAGGELFLGQDGPSTGQVGTRFTFAIVGAEFGS